MADHVKQLALGHSDDASKPQGPVECLGVTFESDTARRDYFLAILREKLKDPEFRAIEGFPIGEDEDILALSDPPYYTACPNPFIADFIRCYGKQYKKTANSYNKEAFPEDVSQGKGGAVYKAHTYHTKVPHEAIARYILHYTEPDDIVLDVFAGHGSTGIAVNFCENPSSEFRCLVEEVEPKVKWGGRKAILIDLSPFATFLCYNINYPLSAENFSSEARDILHRARESMEKDIYGDPEASYIIWSQVLLCHSCDSPIVFAESAMSDKKSIKSKFKCSSCGVITSKSQCTPKKTKRFDSAINKTISENEFIPIWSVVRGNSFGFQEVRKTDLSSIERFSSETFNSEVPTSKMMFSDEPWGDMYRSGYHFGITHVHHFWTERNLIILSKLWKLAKASKYPSQMKFLLTSFMVKTGSKMHNVGMKAGKLNLAGQIFNTLQIPSIFAERNIFELAEGKIRDLSAVFKLQKSQDNCLVGTSSATNLTDFPPESIDYIFIDPPFGKNIMYSEMSFLYEAWLNTWTNRAEEAIISDRQNKGIYHYLESMSKVFVSLYRVLKPGRWMTIEFHNKSNAVWNILQEAILQAGFVVADVRILDKQQGTFKQMTTAGAVDKDLIISAYKPNGGLEDRFPLEAGTERGVWDFIDTHLSKLPIFASKDNQVEILSERQQYLLYDRMVAFHIQRGFSIPLSATEFYAGLGQRYQIRDGMYFLSTQVLDYDRNRLNTNGALQLDLLVTDEESAIRWIHQQLTRKPQSLRELTPKFMQEAQRSWSKHERLFELRELLQENCLLYDEKNLIPPQIISWLKTSSIHRETIRALESAQANSDDAATGLVTDDATLLAAARDLWYIPDPNNASQLEQMREQKLLKEFDNYCQSTQRKLKQFRIEAIRAGFKKCWQEKNEDSYRTIVTIAEKLPTNVLEEDTKLFRFYNQAITRLGDR